MAHHVEVEPELWDEFHRVVNMTSRELLEWLRTRSAGEGTEELPDQAGTETGRRVLDILQKRRAAMTDEDERLMTLGHDPAEAVAQLVGAPSPAEPGDQGSAVHLADAAAR